jgi:hypothetical protein
MLDIAFAKIHRDHLRLDPQADSMLSAGSAGLSTIGEVVVVVDSNRKLVFRPTPGGPDLFDVKLAYKRVHEALADEVHFVTFVIDSDSYVGFDSPGNYYVPVKSEAFGIQYYWDPDRLDPGPSSRYDGRAEWQHDKRLCGVQVLPSQRTGDPIVLRTLLHEIGHQWCAYLTEPATTLSPTLLDKQKKHWNRFFDYGVSCVNESFRIWSETEVGRRDPENDHFGYSALDLYLMGAVGKQHLRELRFFDPTPVGGKHKVAARISVEKLLSAIDERQPPASAVPLEFSLAFVVIAEDAARGELLAQRIESFRPAVEDRFQRAAMFPKNSSGSPRATLKTSRS